MTSDSPFAGLGLAEPLLRAITEIGYTTPTPIQAQAIPHVLTGRDLLAAAQTGTGKTAGFTLPILHLLSRQHPHPHPPGRPRCLILTPTRELAAQVKDSVTAYGQHLPLTSMVFDLLKAAKAAKFQDEDVTRLLTVYERLGGIAE